jgi:inward rectifier potassium channel
MPAKRRRFPLSSGRSVITIGQQSRWSDLYHLLLTMPWWAFFAVMVLLFLAINAIFAALYLIDPDGIANARPGSFVDSFFFSVQTIGTLGYGVMAPRDFYTNVMVTAETFVGIANIAISTGLIFARFSRPTARILFSRVAVIAPFDGVPTLMFRAANQRGNTILEAEVSVSWSFLTTTREGSVMRRFQELRLAKSRSPLFALSWLVMHPIDPTSPLWKTSRETWAACESQLVVVISGNDESFSQRIFARHTYQTDEILWDQAFVDILKPGPDGQLVVDYTHFHDVSPVT